MTGKRRERFDGGEEAMIRSRSTGNGTSFYLRRRKDGEGTRGRVRKGRI